MRESLDLSVQGYVLDEAELKLVEAIENGRAFTFEGRHTNLPQTKVRAEVIRRIVLGLEIVIEGLPRPVRVTGYGVKIVNAHIEDMIVLDNGCMPDGEPAPRLSLEECYIPDGITMLSARIRRLCLRNSRISFLRANDAVIGSQLDIEGVSTCGTMPGAQKSGLCRISLRGATVEDGIEASNAKLACQSARENYVPYNERSHYALDLAGLNSGGDLRLFPNFQAIGGVNLSGAKIRGSVQAHGAYITCEEVSAFDIDGATIEGKLALCARVRACGKDIEPFVAIGDIDMINTSVGHSLNLRGAFIQGSIKGEYLRVGSDARLNGADGWRNNEAVIERFTLTGDLLIDGAKIDGSLDLSGARIHGRVSASTAKLGADLLATLHRHRDDRDCVLPFELTGHCLLDGARIQSDLNMQAARLSGDLSAKGVRISGFCHLNSEAFPSKQIFTCNGNLDIGNTEIGLDFSLSGATILGYLSARNLTVGGNLAMDMTELKEATVSGHENRFTAYKRVNISGAIIRGDLNLFNATLHEGLRARGVQINSALVVKLSEVKRAEPPFTIDLTNARANVIADGPGDGSNYSRSFLLLLEGFTYGRFTLSVDDKSSTNASNRTALKVKDAWRNRLSWLEKQYTDPKRKMQMRFEYKADTYNSLYKTLQNNGLTGDATRVLMEKLRIERQIGHPAVNVFLWIYEFLFKFGLSPIRALVTYTVYCAIITLSIAHANAEPEFRADTKDLKPETQWNALPAEMAGIHLYIPTDLFAKGVLVTQTVTLNRLQAAESHKTNIANDYVEVERHDASRQPEVLCGDRINPALYALDMIVPAVEFNQTTRCDFSENAGWEWKAFKALATILGWLLSSMTVLTLSGIVRRQIEPT